MLCRENGGTILARKVRRAGSFTSRLRGLMFTREFPAGCDALLLTPCNAIHTMFMRYPIDVLFVDSELKVVEVLPNLKPGKICRPVSGARQVIEMPAGKAAACGVSCGERLVLS